MEIKTFRFLGCESSWERNKQTSRLLSCTQIDGVINDFLSHNNAVMVDLKITPVVCKRHNNGGYDDVDLIYTLIYTNRSEIIEDFAEKVKDLFAPEDEVRREIDNLVKEQKKK